MTRMYCSSRIALALALAISVTACGGADDQEEAADEQTEQEVPQAGAPMQADAGPTNAPLTAADIDAYERGMSKEKEILEELVKKAQTVKDDQEKLQVMMEAMEDQTTDDGARAAGLSLDRYKELRNRMDQALGSNSASIMGSALRKQMKDSEAQVGEMAGQGLPPERIEEMRKSIKDTNAQYDAQEQKSLEEIAPDARASFQQRVLHLDSLRMTTAGLRIKVAS